LPAILQVVSAVGSTTSLLDLNDNPAGILVQRGDGLNVGEVGAGDGAMPVWSQPDTITEVTTRRIVVPVILFGATVDAVGAKVGSLVKLVSKPWVLRVRRSGATTDGWLRCYPTVPQMDSRVTGAHGGGVTTGTITASTEPYAYGARVDVGPADATQNPNTASAFTFDVSSPGGDAPTPVVIRCSDTTDLLGGAHATLVAVRRTGAPTSLTGLYTSADAGTGTVLGANVTVTDPLADATFSGGNGVRFAYGTSYAGGSGNAGRLTFTPAVTGAEAPGLYKLLARVRRSVSEDVLFITTIAGLYNLDPLTYVAGGTNTRVIDLGLVQLPAGQPQQLAAPAPAAMGAAPPSIQVDVTKGATGVAVNVDLDWLALIPADEDLGVVYQSAAVAGGVWLTLDGYAQEAYLTTGDPYLAASTGYSGAVKTDWVGGVPRLYPGVANRLYFMVGLNALGSAPANTVLPTFTVSYWPRYTWLP
jgi:hypothetical protein